VSNPFAEVIERSSEVLETIKRVKGERHAHQVVALQAVLGIAALVGLPTAISVGIMQALFRSWDLDVSTPEGRKLADDIVQDAETFTRSTVVK